MTESKKILFAEDSSIVLNLVSKVLQNQNFKVKGVKNGQKLLEEIEKDQYDLVLMDITMPVMDGLDCTKQIRNNPKRHISEVPIIAISGNARNFTLKQYQDIGINDLIEKPINFDLLTTKIIDIFQN